MPFRQFLAFALIALALLPFAATAEDRIRTERVRFDPGAESATVEGRITGREVIDYVVNARAGQAANISLGARSSSTFFNLIPPGGAQWEAVFVGARDGRQFEGVLGRGGDWRVRVYQMGNAADAGETHAFRLEIIVAAGQAAAPGAPGNALQEACAEAARDFFGDREAGVDLRTDEPRVDGTRTVHGGIHLETRAASVMCGFTPDGGRMIEFFVDGEDRTDFVTGGGASGAAIEGVLTPGSSARYVLGARDGQFLTVRVEHLNGPRTEFQIFNPDGSFLLEMIPTDREYRGQLWQSGEHVVEVINRGGAAAEYELTFEID